MLRIDNPYDRAALRRLRRRSWLRYALRLVLGIPWYLVWMVVDACRRWGHSRRKSPFWSGLPALLLGGVVAAAAVAVFLQRPYERVRTYRKAAWKAYSGEDQEAARVYYRKLMNLGDGDDETLLMSARVARESGRTDEADRLLARLLQDGGGTVEALMMRARWDEARPGETTQARAREHLAGVFEREPDHAEANLLMGRILFRAGHPDDAVEFFDRAAEEIPEARIMKAQAYREAGREEEAGSVAREAIMEFRQRLEAADPQRRDLRWRWAMRLAEVQTFLRRFEEALETVGTYGSGGNGESSTDAETRAALVRVYLAWWDEIWKRPPTVENVARCQSLLRAAILLVPEHPAHIVRLAMMAGYDPAHKGTDLAVLRQLIAQGHEMEVSHLTLGCALFREGHLAEARLHFQLGHELSPLVTRIVAALAIWVATLEGQGEGALALVGEAQRLDPHNLVYVEARAQVLMRIERWEEAAGELRRVLAGHPDRVAAHELMAVCLARLGRTLEMEQHRERARELRDAEASAGEGRGGAGMFAAGALPQHQPVKPCRSDRQRDRSPAV